MATLRDGLKTFLNADVTLIAILTGGVENANDVFRDGISADNAPYESDGITLKPFAAIRWTRSGTTEIRAVSERRRLDIYVYQHAGYSSIESAKARLKAILDRKIIASDNFGMGMFHWIDDVDELVAEELGSAPCCQMRWYVDVTRK